MKETERIRALKKLGVSEYLERQQQLLDTETLQHLKELEAHLQQGGNPPQISRRGYYQDIILGKNITPQGRVGVSLALHDQNVPTPAAAAMSRIGAFSDNTPPKIVDNSDEKIAGDTPISRIPSLD